MNPLRHNRTPSPHQATSDTAASDTAVFQAQAASAATAREPRDRVPARDAPPSSSGPRRSGTGVAGNFEWASRRRQEVRALPPQASDYAPFQPEGREPGMAPPAGTRPSDTDARHRGLERAEPGRGGQALREPATSYRQFDTGRSPARPPGPASDRPFRRDGGRTHPALAAVEERLDHASDAVSLSHDLRSAIAGHPGERADLADRAARRFISGGSSPLGAPGGHPEGERVIALASLCNRWRETGSSEAGHASQVIARMVFDGSVPLAAAEPDDIMRFARAFGHFAGPEATVYKNAIVRIADHVAGLSPDQLKTFELRHLARLGGAFGKVERGEDEAARANRHACDRAMTGIAIRIRDLSDREVAGLDDGDRAQLRGAFDKVERGEAVSVRRRRDLCDEAAERLNRPAQSQGRAFGATPWAEVAALGTDLSRRDGALRGPRTGGGDRPRHGQPVLPRDPSRYEPFRSEASDRAAGPRAAEARTPRLGGEDRPELQERPGRAQRPAFQPASSSRRPPRPDERDADPAFAAAVASFDNARNPRELSFFLRDAIKANQQRRPDLALHAAHCFISEDFPRFGPRGNVTIPKHVSAYGALCNVWCKEDVRSKGDAAGRASQKVAQGVVEGRVSTDAAPEAALAQLANAFSHFVEPGAAGAYESALARIADRVVGMPAEELATFDNLNLALLANAFSKVEGGEGEGRRCDAATARIAYRVAEAGRFASFEPQHLALLGNAFAKVENGEDETGDRRGPCDDATAGIADFVAGLPANELEAFDPQGLSNLANAFSKVGGSRCDAATVHLGQFVRKLSPRAFNEFKLQHLAGLANAFSKVGGRCDAATARIAEQVKGMSRDALGAEGSQDLAMLANAFSKLESDRCKEATARIASHVADVSADDIQNYNSQDVSNLADAFARVGGSRCGNATKRLAEHVKNLSRRAFQAYSPQSLANLADAFVEVGGRRCEAATVRIAGYVQELTTNTLKGFDRQSLANLANAFSHIETGCEAAMAQIAKVVENLSPSAVGSFIPQELANLANGFSKVESHSCDAATARIADFVVGLPADKIRKFDPQGFAMLANAFANVEGGDGRRSCDAGTARVADFVAGLPVGALTRFEPQHLAMLGNAFAKVEGDAGRRSCDAATTLIAKFVGGLPADKIRNFDPQGLAMLANAFGKVEGGEGAEAKGRRHLWNLAMARIADRVAGLPVGAFERFGGQNLAMLANAFSKVEGGEGGDGRRRCDAATVQVAAYVADPEKGLSVDKFAKSEPRHLAMLANAFSKVEGGEGEVGEDEAGEGRRLCDAATARIADRVARLPVGALAKFGGQHLAMLADAFNKVEGGEEEAEARHQRCDEATAHIAAGVADPNMGLPVGEFARFNGQDLAMLANAFGKVEGEGGRRSCDAATARIADRVARLPVGALAKFGDQHLAMLANAFGKVERGQEEAEARRQRCDAATAHIAACVADPDKGLPAGKLAKSEPRHLVQLANAFGKVEGGEGDAGERRRLCDAATAGIAGRVMGLRPEALASFGPQNLAMLGNAFAKVDGGDDCDAATARIADCVAGLSTDELASFGPQDLALLAHAFAKVDEPGSIATTVRLVRQAGQNFGAHEVIGLAQLSDAAGSLLAGATLETDDRTRLAHWFERLSNHLVDARDRLADAEPRTLATILKALRRADQSADSRLLTGPAKRILERLETLRDAGGFSSVNLEAMGNLASALVPLFITMPSKDRKPDYPRPLGCRALQLLESLQPVVSRKLGLLGRDALGQDLPEPEAAPGEAHATRIPAISVMQLLRSYEVVASHWTPGVIPGVGKEKDKAERRRHNDTIRARKAELQGWVESKSEVWQELIVNELGAGSWDFFAKLADDDLLAGLDAFGARNAERIVAGHAPAAFDLAAVLAEMDHEPRPPSGDQGLFSLQTVDPQGRPQGKPQEPRYTILHRLTQGGTRPLAVQMPEKYGAHMLAKTVRHEGVPYRMDTAGGSAMKGPRKTLGSIFAEDPDDRARGRQPQPGGKLLAIPWADTLPGSPFLGLLRKLLPHKEAFYYFQRMMRPSPPDIPGLGPHDHVLEGRFPIMVMPDRGPAEEHPFRLTDGDGTLIALRPHDGCGFIKKSIAERMPMMGKVRERQDDPERRVKAFAEGKPAHLPFQALQQLPRNDAVKEEIGKLLDESLKSLDGAALGGEALHRTLTAARIQGEQAVAVPSSDGRVHVPKRKAGGIGSGQGLLLARSPFEKQNMRPITSDRVRTGDDPTARFLDQCAAIQYTMVGEEDAGRAKDDPMFFAKGVMVVVPDEFWPTEGPAAESGVVLSAEDTKTHSDWGTGKAREKEDTARSTRGILLAHDFYAPGSLVAVPPEEQERLSGDFDGDTLNLLAHLPALWAHVSAFDQEERDRNRKPVSMGKTHTPAVNPETGQYEPGRGQQIVSLLGKVLETFSGLQNNYLALPKERQVKVAEQALLGSFEGFPRGFRKTLGELLRADEEDRAGGGTRVGPEADETIAQLRRMADAWLEEARHPAVKDLAKLVSAGLGRWRTERDEAYGGGADGGRVALPESIAALLPDAEAEDLKEQYTTAETAAGQLESLLGLSNRMEPPPDIDYDGNDPHRSFMDLLALGVIVGTDAFKSNTGTRVFGQLATRFQSLVDRQSGGRPPPYAKITAREIAAGTFDPEAALARLAFNPTLAADVMEAALAAAQRAGLLPLRPSVSMRRDRTPTADELRETAVRLQTEAESRQEEVKAVMRRAVRTAAGTTLQARPDGVRGVDSLGDHLRAMAQNGKLDDFERQPISSALRFSLVLPQKRFADTFGEVVDALMKEGHEQVETTNWWLKKDDPTYRGVNVTMQAEDGYRYTVQFHTDQSYAAKDATHDDYKENMALGFAPDPGRRAELESRMRAAFKEVEEPEGIEEIHNRRRMHVPADEAEAPAPSGPARQPYKTREALDAATTRVKPRINDAMRLLADGEGWRFTTVGAHSDSKKAVDWKTPGAIIYVGSPKGRARAEEKVRMDLGGDWWRLLDKVSGVVVVDRAEEVDDAVRKLEGAFTVVDRKDRRGKPTDVGYRDLALHLRQRGAGRDRNFVFEVQVHTKMVHMAKLESHQHYERTRTVDSEHGGPPAGWNQARWVNFGKWIASMEAKERAAALDRDRPEGWEPEEWSAYAYAKAQQARIFAEVYGEPDPEDVPMTDAVEASANADAKRLRSEQGSDSDEPPGKAQRRA